MPFLRFLPLPTPFRVSLPRCGAVLFECLGGWIRVGGCAGSAGFTTIIKPVVSAPEPMTSKTTGAVMADVWSMPNPEAEPTPPPSPTPTPPASLHGDAANDVKPLPTPSQRIRNAAVEATVAAAAPPVPPATTNGFSDASYTACNENMAEARDMAIKAAKQAGYFTTQAAAYRVGKLGQVELSVSTTLPLQTLLLTFTQTWRPLPPLPPV